MNSYDLCTFGPQPTEKEWKEWIAKIQPILDAKSWEKKWWNSPFEWSMNPQNMTEKEQFELYLDLHNYCNSEDFNSKIFSTIVKEYTRFYRKLDYTQQGEVAYLIREYFKEYEYIQNFKKLCDKFQVYKLSRKEYDRKRYLEKKDIISKTTRKWQLNNPEWFKWRSAKIRAEKLGIPFDIEIKDIEIPEYCPILGIKLQPGNTKSKESSPSLDRKVPEKGYTKDNIWVISNKANTMKNNASKEELISFARWIVNNYS